MESLKRENLKIRECRSRYSFHAEFEGCLSITKGQNLLLHKNNNDGWSLVENECQQTGFVPSNYLDIV